MGTAESTASRSAHRHDWLLALGCPELPETLEIDGVTCTHELTFKHDFFAATGVYVMNGRRIVVKFGRSASLLGVSLAWLGRWLTFREARHYHRLAGIEGVPAFVGMAHCNAFAHDFIPGRPLTADMDMPDDYFARLDVLLDQVHQRDTAYVDLNKPENILVGDDGRPYLVDFQISYAPLGRWDMLGYALLRLLQRCDRYHLAKQVQRSWQTHMTDAQRCQVAMPPVWIRVHRLIARPIILLRRRFLVWLGVRDSMRTNAETGTLHN